MIPECSYVGVVHLYSYKSDIHAVINTATWATEMYNEDTIQAIIFLIVAASSFCMPICVNHQFNVTNMHALSDSKWMV